MASPSDSIELPDANSAALHLSHPTPHESVKICTYTSTSWKDSLTLSSYLEESQYMMNVPLVKDEGTSTWILVDKNLPPDQRAILASCETFRKRALTSDAEGKVSDGMVHGIASVFCPSEYRGRGYAARMMLELATILRTWQVKETRCFGSILYSDIGKTYYSKLGWKPNATNAHLVFAPSKPPRAPKAKKVSKGDISHLCEQDEVMVRKAMARPAQDMKTRMTIIQDSDHMLWHIAKEEFACKHLFGKIPQSKGAIIGSPGKQVWAIWTHRYYGHPESERTDNVLYILRLVVEANNYCDEPSLRNNDTELRDDLDQAMYLKAVLEAAQAEAAEWNLDHVNLWSPTVHVQDLIRQTGIKYAIVEREEDGIASVLWYDTNGEVGQAPLWLYNEHYAWC